MTNSRATNTSPGRAPVAGEQTGCTDSLQTVAVVGAGQMGRGIARAAALAGRRVIVADVNERAAQDVVKDLEQLVRSGSSGVSDQAQPLWARSDADIAVADLVIEAIAEKKATKTELYARLEPFLADSVILATNSSSIPITELAAALHHPHRFCGLHFCHPVEERPLVEVIGGAATSDRTLEQASRFATSIGMSPLHVPDGPGFLVNRLLVPYMNEALELLLEGVSPKSLELEALDFGFPQGPLQLMDEFGIDVALQVGRTLFWSYPDRIVPSELLIAMFKAGRLGNKSGGGFCAADGGIAPGAAELLQDRYREANVDPGAVRLRLFLPMLVEATRLCESAAISEQQVDDALRDGLGLTRRYEGLFRAARSRGFDKVTDDLKRFESLGKRFEPTAYLQP